MATTSPWSVKGVDPEAREAAKIAARKAGVTVGQWLNHTIRVAASEQLRGGGRGVHPPPPPLPTEPAYGEHGGHGAASGPPPGYEQQPPNPGGYQTPAPTMQAIFESIQKLSSRIEAAEMKTTAAITPLAEQVDHLSQQIEEVRSHTGVSTAPVERAMMRLSERLQKIEETRGPARKSSGGLFGLFKDRG